MVTRAPRRRGHGARQTTTQDGRCMGVAVVCGVFGVCIASQSSRGARTEDIDSFAAKNCPGSRAWPSQSSATSFCSVISALASLGSLLQPDLHPRPKPHLREKLTVPRIPRSHTILDPTKQLCILSPGARKAGYSRRWWRQAASSPSLSVRPESASKHPPTTPSSLACDRHHVVGSVPPATRR